MVLIWGQNISDKACVTFIEFIAREQQDILLKALE